MCRVLKKSLFVGALLLCTAGLSGCKTTSDERILYGTIAGAGIGAGIGAAGGASVLPGAAAGAFVGATVAVLTE